MYIHVHHVLHIPWFRIGGKTLAWTRFELVAGNAWQDTEIPASWCDLLSSWCSASISSRICPIQWEADCIRMLKAMIQSKLPMHMYVYPPEPSFSLWWGIGALKHKSLSHQLLAMWDNGWIQLTIPLTQLLHQQPLGRVMALQNPSVFSAWQVIPTL